VVGEVGTRQLPPIRWLLHLIQLLALYFGIRSPRPVCLHELALRERSARWLHARHHCCNIARVRPTQHRSSVGRDETDYRSSSLDAFLSVGVGRVTVETVVSVLTSQVWPPARS
jgi:hypothetical protein